MDPLGDEGDSGEVKSRYIYCDLHVSRDAVWAGALRQKMAIVGQRAGL